MDIGRWDNLDWFFAVMAVFSWVLVASFVAFRKEVSRTKTITALISAAVFTASVFDLLPDWPMVFLVIAFILWNLVRDPAMRQRGNWDDALGKMGVAVLILSLGLGRLAEHFGHPEWIGGKGTLATVAFLLLAPSLFSGVIGDRPGPRLGALLRFVGTSLAVVALVIGPTLVLDNTGILREEQTASIIAVTTILWGISTLAYIFTNGFGRAGPVEEPEVSINGPDAGAPIPPAG